MVALTVTFTVCDAQQIGLSPSDGSSLAIKYLASWRTVRPVQKAPPILAPLRVTSQSFASRKQATGTPRYFDVSKCFRYALVSPACGLKGLSSQQKSGETTRGPPRMDPPISC